MKAGMLKKRLFIALDLPLSGSNGICGVCENIKGIRWTKREQLHLTLAFLGNTDVEIIPQLIEELNTICFKPFELTVSGTSFFRSRIFYLNLNNSPHLTALKKQIDNAVFKILEIEPSSKAFIPHITLTRLKQQLPSSKQENLLNAFGPVLPVNFTVNRFLLYESKTCPSGAVHNKLKEISSI
jgi:2'-5' RNA ligase